MELNKIDDQGERLNQIARRLSNARRGIRLRAGLALLTIIVAVGSAVGARFYARRGHEVSNSLQWDSEKASLYISHHDVCLRKDDRTLEATGALTIETSKSHFMVHYLGISEPTWGVTAKTLAAGALELVVLEATSMDVGHFAELAYDRGTSSLRLGALGLSAAQSAEIFAFTRTKDGIERRNISAMERD